LVRFCRSKLCSRIRNLLVSIPPWFDFARQRSIRRLQSLRVSIPPWFDFAWAASATPVHTTMRFNPTLVRFCLGCLCYPRPHYDAFQSHLGSILPVISANVSSTGSPFQSHLGSILPSDPRENGIYVYKFQSHLGSILLVKPNRDATHHAWFQSHLGSILPWTKIPICPCQPGFNPTLVRFCLNAARARDALHRGFNPTLVRFCLSLLLPLCAPIRLVSIPPWFDFAT